MSTKSINPDLWNWVRPLPDLRLWLAASSLPSRSRCTTRTSTSWPRPRPQSGLGRTEINRTRYIINANINVPCVFLNSLDFWYLSQKRKFIRRLRSIKYFSILRYYMCFLSPAGRCCSRRTFHWGPALIRTCRTRSRTCTWSTRSEASRKCIRTGRQHPAKVNEYKFSVNNAIIEEWTRNN